MADIPTTDVSPKLFRIEGSLVSGDSGQEDANAFAADFQGLRHFGKRIGEALELDGLWHAAFREADFSHFWATESTEGDSGMGVMVAAKMPLVELFDLVTQD